MLAVQRVLQSGRFILGEEVKAFEAEFASFLGGGHVVGVASGTDLADMPLATLQGFSRLIAADVFEVLTLEGSVNARDHIGATAPARVLAAAHAARERLAARGG